MRAAAPEVTAGPPKILEIGGVPYMWKAFPQTTEFYSTWPDETVSAPQDGRHIVTFAGMPRLARRLADPSFDLIVVHAPAFRPWGGRAVVRGLFRRSILKGTLPLWRGFAAELLRVAPPRPSPSSIWRMRRPSPAATHFCSTAARFISSASSRPTTGGCSPEPCIGACRRRGFVPSRAIASALPSCGRFLSACRSGWPNGLPDTCRRRQEKTIDVFFAGRIRNSSTVRERGFEELLSLRRDGYAIDVCEQEIGIDEYLARCARAHLVWSPEGYGWQCFRTYEAAICGAAPLCSRQGIERYRPLMEGVHAVYYDVEPGELSRAAKAALADRDRLRAIGRCRAPARARLSYARRDRTTYRRGHLGGGRTRWRLATRTDQQSCVSRISHRRSLSGARQEAPDGLCLISRPARCGPGRRPASCGWSANSAAGGLPIWRRSRRHSSIRRREASGMSAGSWPAG